MRPEVEQRQLDEEEADQVTPSIPVPMPATLEPEWQNGKLTLPNIPLNDDLVNASIDSALSALKSDFSEFVTEIGSEANIDERASGYLARIAKDIPTSPPPQHELFSLAHKEQFFIGYAKTVSDEWPEFLAARFHALGVQFSRVMKQFPEWREFKTNADQKQLSSVDIENIEQLAIAMEQSLREELALDFVDQGIADIIADMAEHLSPDTESISPEQADAFIQSGKDLLAADLLTSIDNILKPVAEAVLVARGAAIEFAKYSGEHFGIAAKKEYEAQLAKLGKGFVKWGVRLLKSSPVLALIQTYFPSIYAWLEAIIKLIV